MAKSGAGVVSRWRTRRTGERSARAPRGPVSRPSPFVDLGAMLSGGARRELRLELDVGIVLTVVRG